MEISGLDTVWVLIAAFLVFFMQAGFALVESGFTQSKNAVNIIMKNLLDVCFGSIAYIFIGFGIMFGAGNAFFGQEFFAMAGIPDVWGTLPTWAFFLFQMVFAATSATIVSGAVAERTKFGAYVIFSIIITALIYPLVGHWIWGGGWLSEKGFVDFAGSTVVHSVGGWAALAGIIVVGARTGRFKNYENQKRFDGHNIPLAALGVFILWFGWFGFNGGSQLGAEGADNANVISLVVVNTQMAAAAGVIGALTLGWLRTRIFNAGFALNGALGGLVAITAPCAVVNPVAAILIGSIGGVVVVVASELLQRLKLDDAVGAVSVHLGAGMWGTLAVGLFAVEGGLFYGGGWHMLWIQLIGVVSVGLFAFMSSMLMFKALAMTIGVRADRKEEEAGLDLKHGQAAYPDFAGTK